MELKQYVPYVDDLSSNSQNPPEPQKQNLKVTLAFKGKKAKQKKNFYFCFLVLVLVLQVLALGWLIKENHFSSDQTKSMSPVDSRGQETAPSPQREKKSTPSDNKSGVIHMALTDKSF